MKAFKASNLKIIETAVKKDLPDFTQGLDFGKYFTDYMIECDWDIENGWSDPEIVPFHDLCLHPACSVLHYAIECFEGMKAYRNGDEVLLFRPEQNFERMKLSCERLCFPTIEPEEVLPVLAEFLEMEKRWIPSESDQTSLYIRPTMISTDDTLGVHKAKKAKFFLIAGPVGGYFSAGSSVDLLVNQDFCRAFPGGTGSAKLGANYAPTIYPQALAAEKGYSQILWVDQEGYVQEVGAMNVFVHWIDEDGVEELVTCPLSHGTVLPGITRDSVLKVASEWGIKVSERDYNLTDIEKAYKEGRILDVFGSGTAAVIVKVGSIKVDGGAEWTFQSCEDNLSARLFERLADIQRGRVEHEWCVNIKDLM